MNRTFQDLVSEINSIPTKYLKAEKTNFSNTTLRNKKNQAAMGSFYWWLSITGVAALSGILYFIRRIKKAVIQH
jgi:hypothetical protein